MLPQVAEAVLARWTTIGGDRPTPRTIAFLGLPGAVEGGTSTFLACGDDRRPAFVVKVFRHSGERARREASLLRHFESTAPWSHGRVPRLLHHATIAGADALVESIVPGRPMPVHMGADDLPEPAAAAAHFEAIIAWLVRLRTLAPLQPIAPLDLSALAGRFEALFDTDPAERRLLRRLTTAGHMPTSPVLHGDLCRQNVLQWGDGPAMNGVIDWTDAEVGALPAEDLLFFMTTYFVQARGAGFAALVDGFEDTFFGARPYADAVRRAFTDYCERIGIEADLRLHLGLLAMRQAVRHAERQERLSATEPLPRFTVWLAAVNGLNYAQARRVSMWRYYFLRLAAAAEGP